MNTTALASLSASIRYAFPFGEREMLDAVAPFVSAVKVGVVDGRRRISLAGVAGIWREDGRWTFGTADVRDGVEVLPEQLASLVLSSGAARQDASASA